QVVAIEGVLDALAEPGADVRLVAVADSLEQQVLEASALEDFAEDVKDAAIERLALDPQFFKEPEIDLTFAGFLGDKVPEVTDLLLVDAVDAAKALFKAVRIPRQVIIDHQVGVLEVHSFASGIGGDEDADSGVGPEHGLQAAAFIAVGAAVDGDDGVSIAEDASNLLVQVVQSVAMLGKEDELAQSAAGIAHGGIVLQDAGEFVPFAVLPGGDNSPGLMFESPEEDNLLLQLGDGVGSSGLIDQRFLEPLLFLGLDIVV